MSRRKAGDSPYVFRAIRAHEKSEGAKKLQDSRFAPFFIEPLTAKCHREELGRWSQLLLEIHHIGHDQ
jgi:hypothetical protein